MHKNIFMYFAVKTAGIHKFLSNKLIAYKFGPWHFCSGAVAEKSIPQSKIGQT